MSAAALVLAALLLSLERLFYLWVWNWPQPFAAWCGRRNRTPIDVLETACGYFKLLQASVFVGWCVLHGAGPTWPGGGGTVAVLIGSTLVLVGQFLNYSVFRRLGRIGVFYGIRFGHHVRWSSEFPFSVLKHPQYVGALLTIWGVFLLIRFPHSDWYWLPTVETLLYSAGAYLERNAFARRTARDPAERRSGARTRPI
jgi:methylene-fatty-acyl-phospholipid synthase